MTSTTNQTTVVGTFGDEANARRAVSALQEAGFPPDDIRRQGSVTEASSLNQAPTRTGLSIQGSNTDVSTQHAGSTLVAVTTEGRQGEARTILQQSAVSVHELQTTPPAAPNLPPLDGQLAYPQTGSAWTLPLREEELVVHKHSVQRGEVHIRRDVVVVKRTIEVSLRREELVIERYDGPSADSGQLGPDPSPGSVASELRGLQPGQVVRLVLLEEESVIEMRGVAYEEVAIGKTLVPDTREVTADVRREELRVDNPYLATIVAPNDDLQSGLSA
jgi:stress response protein YsnF